MSLLSVKNINGSNSHIVFKNNLKYSISSAKFYKQYVISRAAEPERGILPASGALIKNHKPELSLKFRTRAGATAV